MLRTYLLVAGVAATSLAISAAAGCGGTDVAGTGGAGSTGTGGGAAGVHAEPPPPGPMMAPDGAASVTFAVKKLYLGDYDRNGMADKVNGWKNYGFDIDGKISTASSTDLCKPRNNAPVKNVYPDGTNGIDNSFGKNILQIILGLSANASTSINDSISKGSFTIMLDMQKLGTGGDYNPITTKLYGGGTLLDPMTMMPVAPKWDGTDAWPVLPELLNDPKDITSSKVVFDKSYMVKNTWVSGSKGTINLNLSVQGYNLSLTIASALIAMDISPDHKTATNGTIAGVLATDTLTSELKKVAGGFDPTLCSGPTIDSIISQIEQASDIMQDGTSGDPSKTCDGISIGLGFDANIVKLGPIAPPAMGSGDPCAASDAGAD